MNISYDNALILIKQLKCVAAKILDMNGKKVYEVLDAKGPDELCNRLNLVIPNFKAYGRLEMIAATEKDKLANWKGAATWLIDVTGNPVDPKATATPTFNTPFHVPPGYQPIPPEGYVHKDILALQLQLAQANNNSMIEWYKLQQKNKSMIPMEAIPIAGKILGWSKDDIKEMMMFMMMGNSQGNMNPQQMMGMMNNPMGGNALKGPDTNNLTQQGTETDYSKFTPEQVQEKCEELLAKIITHKEIGFHAFVTLCEALLAKPALAQTAIQFLKS